MFLATSRRNRPTADEGRFIPVVAVRQYMYFIPPSRLFDSQAIGVAFLLPFALSASRWPTGTHANAFPSYLKPTPQSCMVAVWCPYFNPPPNSQQIFPVGVLTFFVLTSVICFPVLSILYHIATARRPASWSSYVTSKTTS